ncbi:carbonic anhydrase 15 [Scleropages formosus]|uniref:Carbonic anhydrase n=1 Tax=Scleropages formosus TaxID=113540 RepID=A0A8C9RVD8_SCLFO|nr:carbonic anhydrase 4-like [Scleropages formosus]
MCPTSAAPSRGIVFALIMFAATSLAVDYCYDQYYCSPYSWGDAYPSCHPIVGAHHSPINLDGNMARNDSLGGVHLEGFQGVHAGEWRLKNNGHSVVLELGGGMAVMGGGLPGTYQTLQLHFHWGSSTTNGSEHTLDSRRYPMEMHIVSRKSIHHNLTSALHDPSGLAVLGVFIDVTGLDNDNFTVISSLIPSIAYKGKTVTVKPFPLLNLLPAQNLSQFYRYHGSLTTPPCSQAVMWTVFEVPIYVSQQQINAFTSGIYQSEEGANKTLLQRNFRHIHETFSREVLASRDATLIPVSAVASARSALALVLFALLLLPTWLP